MQPIRVQTGPQDRAAPSVLVEGRPVALFQPGEATGLPHILVEGRPAAVVSSPDGRGSASVLGSEIRDRVSD